MMPVSNKGETKMSDTKETKKSAPVAKASVKILELQNGTGDKTGE